MLLRYNKFRYECKNSVMKVIGSEVEKWYQDLSVEGCFVTQPDSFMSVSKNPCNKGKYFYR